MSHTHYEERCFIVDEIDSGEASRSYFLLCENLGGVWARATGVRKVESKLRYYLQIYNNVKITLVEGREFYRIVGVREFDEMIGRNRMNFFEKKLHARLMKIIRKLIVGQERNSLIYDTVYSLLRSLLKIRVENEEEFESFELFMVAKILSKLGYGTEINFYIEGGDDLHFVSKEFLVEVREKRKEILPLVNSALKESHL